MGAVLNNNKEIAICGVCAKTLMDAVSAAMIIEEKKKAEEGDADGDDGKIKVESTPAGSAERFVPEIKAELDKK